MCGRFVQHADPEIYASRYDVDDIAPLPERTRPGFNVAPTQNVLAIRQHENGRRELLALRWGLVPYWSKGPDNRYSMINARSESVHEKPAYRAAFRRRRCLIPAEGFYEWQGKPGAKQPYLIRREDAAPFAFAGLWEHWHPKGGGPDITSCSIIVTGANPLMAPIHDRMPVILRPEDQATWLDPANEDIEGLRALLGPASVEGWTVQPVSKAVNTAANDGPELVAPLAAEG